MGFDTITKYRADCDIRLGPDGQPMQPQPGTDDWMAWSDAGAPKSGPLHDVLGRACPTAVSIHAHSAAEARRKLQADGWKFVNRGRPLGWRAFCPEHREVQL